jgi:hypothetical protein
MAEYRERAKDAGTVSSTVINTPNSTATRAPAYLSLAEEYGLTDMQFATPEDVEGQTLEQEYQSYVTAPLSKPGTDMLKFWEVSNLSITSLIYSYTVQQLSKSTQPTFFGMSLDFIPIQASAVPSERVFSSSAETDTKKRNRINPVLMEALQMLKFALKQSHLNFTEGWATPQSMLQDEEPDSAKDLLSDLLSLNSEDAINEIIQELADDDHDDAG